MYYILSIDDTDNLYSLGTGEILEEIIKRLESNDLCRCSRITRHQLFFSPLVKYTSHNSAMTTVIDTMRPEDVFALTCDHLKNNSAKGSDPGVCLMCKDMLSEADIQKLREYGVKAKTQYVKKQQAHDLADKLDIMLREVGGEGIGVIGALAGAALRLDGNDGRYKGKFYLVGNQDNMLCRDILTHPYIDRVMTTDGRDIPDDTEVFIVDQIKTVHLNHQSVLLVKKQMSPEGEVYVNIGKSGLKEY